MATLAADTPRVVDADVNPTFNDLPVVAADIIFEGSALTHNASGDVTPLLVAGTFVGFCEKNADNSAGAAGDIKVKVRQRGIIKLDVVGVNDDDDVSAAVFASDDDTFTLTTAAALRIGKIIRWSGSGTTCYVYFEAEALRSI